MVNHPRQVKGFNGSLDELACAIGNMTYDQTAEVIGKLADDLKRQADADHARGRVKLATELYATAERLYSSRDRMNAAWTICIPYMNDSK
ncbi:hypothetical protein HN587_06590 [Candidatus Woesearchaeota archaeon]|jgi:hypothetical protein|nr:hypothetical protein [Candidatus Woesearchaeota archaeon]